MKEVIYFSHDANAMTDTKILNMRADYGMEGYGLFWAIIEQLRSEENYILPLSKNTLKVNTNTSINIEEYINNCINEYGLFNVSDDGKYFYSNSLKRRMSIKDEKKIRRSEAGKKGAEKRWKNGNDMAMPLEDDSNAIVMPQKDVAKPSKKMANDGKIKEKKVKEIININETKLNETFNLIINNNIKELAEKNKISELELQGYINVLKRLKIYVSKEFLKIMMPGEVELYKYAYYAILELYKSSYKVYINKLRKEVIVNKYEKTREYIGSIQIENDKNFIKEFMSYFIRCLQNELDNST